MIKQAGTTLYELNAQGVNHWFAGVHAGFDDLGNRTTEKELNKIAVKLSAVDELYDALEAAMYFITVHNDDPDITREMAEAYERLVSTEPYRVLAKVKGIL